jgi:hypothetical protein
MSSGDAKASNSTSTKLLVCGLGGGLDIVNASIVHFAAQQAGISSQLGSVRPCPQYFMQAHTPFHHAGTMVNANTTISRRYCMYCPLTTIHLLSVLLY